MTDYVERLRKQGLYEFSYEPKSFWEYGRGNNMDKLVDDLKNGKKMPQPQQVPGEAVRTNGQDTVLYMPQKNTSDREFLRSVGSSVLKMQFEAEKMPLEKRDQFIFDKLEEMEKKHIQ